MCGIAGIITTSDAHGGVKVLEKMLAVQAHRGPDGNGIRKFQSNNWNILLGHCRLAIIDIEGGKQPLSNFDDSLHITFNGEIYNFLDLKKELQAKGLRFNTNSDTEVLVNHYGAYGSGGLAHLNGMFAFAIWDEKHQQLLLARDRVGIKPLYYSRLPSGGLVFASELTSLLEHPQVARRISNQGLSSYFFRDYAHAPLTLIEGVYKLEPAHFIIWKSGELSAPRCYWEPPKQQVNSEQLDDRKLAHELKERLMVSVRRQLVSDVSVGIFLSGGIDSSSVAVLAQKQYREKIQTFSISFEDSQYDESKFSKLIAKQIQSNHIVRTLTEDSLLLVLDRALDCLDEPMADPSILPTFLLSELASEHVKVCLGGDGGDELWGGYPTYRAHRYARLYEKVPESIRNHVIRKFALSLRTLDTYQSLEWKLKRFTGRWDEDPLVRHRRWMSNIDLPNLSEVLVDPKLQMDVKKSIGDDFLNKILLLDFQTYLPGSVLTKVDRASMAHSLEVRPPFLDTELIDWAFGLPSRFKLFRNTGKFLLKKAMQTELPVEVIKRSKRGFAIPLSKWIKGPLSKRVSKILQESPLWDLNILYRETFIKWNESHQCGYEDWSRTLWALIVLDHWIRRISPISNPQSLDSAL